MAHKIYVDVLACCLLFVVAVCWLSPGETVMLACCWSVWLGVDPNLIEMPQKRLCCNVLGEDVGRICHRAGLDDSHDVVEHQLLDEKVLQLDVFGLLWWADSCCHDALPARRIRVDLDVAFFLLSASVKKLRMCSASVAPAFNGVEFCLRTAECYCCLCAASEVSCCSHVFDDEACRWLPCCCTSCPVAVDVNSDVFISVVLTVGRM